MTVRLPNPMSAVVWLAFFLPGALSGGRLDRALGVSVFLLGGAVLLAKPSPWEARKPSARAFKIFLLLELLYAVSFSYSAAFNGIETGPRDFLELARYVLLGTFAVYLIRHYDDQVRSAMEWAMTAALYYALLVPSADPRGYAAVLTLCWLLFFSRLRLRFLHAAAALLVVVFSGGRACWTAALLVLSAAGFILLHRELVRRRVAFAAPASLVVCALLAAVPAARLRPGLAAAPAESRTLQLIRRSPVLGWGPAEYAGLPAGDSQYLRWLLKGGALGAGLILAGLGFAGYRLLRAASGDSLRLAGAAAFLGSVALMLAAGPFLESFRLSFMTALFAAGVRGASR